MQVTTTFHNMLASPGLEAAVERWTVRLEEIHDQIVGCDVRIEQKHRHRRDTPFIIHLSLRVPGTHIAFANEFNLDVYVALAETFRAARRHLMQHPATSRHE